jgi:hypothetical protein
MSDDRFYSPLKIGLLIVILAYFLFTFHAMFTLSWIGEWESIGRTSGFVIFVEDVSGTIGLIFRFVGSLIALGAVIVYFFKKNLQTPTTMKILKVILIFEAIYWLGLLASGVMPLIYLRGGNRPITSVLTSVFLSDIPCFVESLAIPIALFMLASKLSPNKPAKEAIKWGLIAGTVYIFVFWLVNTTIWISTIRTKGVEYLTIYPENLVSFILTTIGLLVLTVFSAYFSKNTIGNENLDVTKLRTAGAIITALGLYFLWNYLTWIFFGKTELWSSWYAWFLGHNLDLWILAIPLVGLPLLFRRRASYFSALEKSKEHRAKVKLLMRKKLKDN